MGVIKQRRRYANYLNVGKGSEEFVLMGAGFTELNESPAAQTISKKYVNDKNATKSIVSYDWSTAFNTDMIRDEKAVDFICQIGELQKVGSDCETDYLIVDLDKLISADTFYARKFRVAIEVASFDNNDGDMGATGNLLGIGDLDVGTFNVKTKVFTEGTVVVPAGTLNVTSAASASTSGKTLVTVTPAKTGSNSYRYIVAASVTIPALNDVCLTGYTVWDGTTEIVATTGNKILIVEVDGTNRCQKAGVATVTSKA